MPAAGRLSPAEGGTWWVVLYKEDVPCRPSSSGLRAGMRLTITVSAAVLSLPSRCVMQTSVGIRHISWLKPEKAMATYSSTLAWKIPWMEEPGGLQSMGSLRVGHDWATSLSLFTFMHWRRKWEPTPVFLPGESQGKRSLVGCCLWGPAESDTTEAT